MQNEIYMLWLSTLLPQLGSRKLNHLLSNFANAKDIFLASPSLLKTHAKLTENALSTITKNRSLDYIERMLQYMESKQMTYMSRYHERFPTLLTTIPDPPVGLFYIGELPADATHKVAIIGSRRCSEYGLLATRILAKPLAENDVVIVSGMARGVDSMAHRGALDGGGKTIAVLGCGADVCYPAENNHLRAAIIENGCVISEYPPGQRPTAAFFPARNRIISGICQAIIVAEAGKKSGTQITVDQATEQGREVFAIPGSIISPLSAGTNQLIQEGATPVTNHTDVLFALGIPEKDANALNGKNTGHQTTDAQHKTNKPALNSLAPEEKLVYDALALEPISFDSLVISTKIASGTLRYLCTSLELKGLIRRLPGARFCKN